MDVDIKVEVKSLFLRQFDERQATFRELPDLTRNSRHFFIHFHIRGRFHRSIRHLIKTFAICNVSKSATL
ncbi:CLUMA_CG017915, isoform A [Clunio marinus]|uniref:CLUMA_CG017915, isoform A n=1 Tax=Clunio marinus TaxID=568069 RepID=A0A1J1J0C8_9DIPT|nr:CLUMA_CG017915, isoform A [Clunio marinus]